ncbi:MULTISPECIES: anthrone oxygenase family protein [unclassified Streptomyces]|uniref:anthrone oxygenase family protein n=1 Tax=unclassified Streptomyces TaxID=2593676 RepID=UPI0033C15421
MTDTRGTDSRGRGTAGVVLGAAAVTMGLIAGAFYIFACAVMPALGRSGDRVYIEVMQNINDVIQNPVFFASFMGALLFTAVSAWQLRGTGPHRWVVAALVVYVVAFALTSFVNVPLNDDLMDAGDPAKIADPAAVREKFEDAWVAWNIVRAVLCTLSAALLVRALVLFGRSGRSGRSGRGERPGQSAYLDSATGSSASR